MEKLQKQLQPSQFLKKEDNQHLKIERFQELEQRLFDLESLQLKEFVSTFLQSKNILANKVEENKRSW